MSKRVIEQLIAAGVLPAKFAKLAAFALGSYPSVADWRRFSERLLTTVGVVAIAFSLIFFIAFNWLELGKLGKFALVEGALILTLGGYLLLVFLKKSLLLQQLLLLAASLITGALLALVGQVYQTGADSWQLFALWSLLILPWVLIARFPILWMLWLGLINLAVMLGFAPAIGLPALFTFFIVNQIFSKILLLTLINGFAFLAWLVVAERLPILQKANLPTVNQASNPDEKKPIAPVIELHWSTNLVGLLAISFATIFVSYSIVGKLQAFNVILAHGIWLIFLGLLWYQFYRFRLNLLQLTFFCAAMIAVMMVWIARLVNFDWRIETLFLMAVVLLISSAAAVGWLRRLFVASLLERRLP